MNYIKALQRFLQKDVKIKNIVQDRIGFLRMSGKTQTPFIVFNEQNRQSNDLNRENYKAGVDIFSVLVDVACDYQSTIEGRELRNYIREKLGDFKGKILDKNNEIIREGTIVFDRFLGCDYDEKKDLVLWGAIYTFKNHYAN